ncbi:nuclear transport factor 2 family protein [Ornithinibacillus sp. 4-3]|uniref:Nuclear transport factor 2 family protein n=1 Tax=Ornithinibacillus sp. 4-3 TaxID=3231488 RepID=A0AB39HKY3_9BACI
MSVTKQLMEKINHAFANGDVDSMIELATEDIVMNEIGHGISEGKAAYIEKMEPMRGYKADVYEVHRTLIEGNTAVIEGEMEFVEGDEKVIYCFTDWYEFENEKIKSITVFMIKQANTDEN